MNIGSVLTRFGQKRQPEADPRERERQQAELAEIQAVATERHRLKEVIRERIEATLTQPRSEQVQDELARLLRPIDAVESVGLAQRKELLWLVGLSLKALSVDPPGLAFVQANRRNIDRFLEYESNSVLARLLRKCGNSPLLAALYGSCLSFLVFVYLTGAVVYLIFVPTADAGDDNLLTKLLVWLGLASASSAPAAPSAVPEASALQSLLAGDVRLLSFGLFCTLIVAAQIGAFISITTRLQEFATLDRPNILLVFLNATIKPVISMVMALVVVALLTSEIVVIPSLKLSIPPVLDGIAKQTAIFFVIGFFCGYSERWAADILGRAESAVAGAPSRRDAKAAPPD